MAGFRVFLVSLSTLIFCACSVAYGEDMASNLTELSTWTNPILGPDPGDALQATPVRTMAEEINGRTNVLRGVSPYHTTTKNFWTQLEPLKIDSSDSYSIAVPTGLVLNITAASGDRLLRLPINNDAAFSADGNRQITSIVLFAGTGYTNNFVLYWEDSSTILETVFKNTGDATVTFSAPFPASMASHGAFLLRLPDGGSADDISLRALVTYTGAAVP